jgi:glycosyltransferase involved in cell wall biosynthesis
MRILFLTDNFPPEVNAPASRTFEHCRHWVREGHKVTVITGAPNFPKGVVYAGYRNRLWQWEELEGVRVLRVWTYITANEGFLRRSLDYASFMVSAFAASLFLSRPQVVVGTSPQFFTVCAAWAAATVKGVPFVFELRDLWPASICAVGAIRSGLLLNALERMELFLYRRAKLIIALTDSFRTDLIRRGVAASKIKVITNGADLSRFKPRPKDQALLKRLGLVDCFVAGYVGTHGLAHGLETLLEAAAILQGRADDRAIRLLFLGDGAMKSTLTHKSRKLDLRNIIFLDSVPKADVPRYWSLLDASIVHLRPDPLFKTVIPSKIFESMAMGIPILLGAAGESAQLVNRLQVGETFTPGDCRALADSLSRLSQEPERLADLRQGCLKAADSFDRDTLAGQMLSALSDVTKVIS